MKEKDKINSITWHEAWKKIRDLIIDDMNRAQVWEMGSGPTCFDTMKYPWILQVDKHKLSFSTTTAGIILLCFFSVIDLQIFAPFHFPIKLGYTDKYYQWIFTF